MVYFTYLMAPLKCSWMKKLTEVYKPWIDIFLSINGTNSAKRLIDFGNDFLLGMAFQRHNIVWQDVCNSCFCFAEKI